MSEIQILQQEIKEAERLRTKVQRISRTQGGEWGTLSGMPNGRILFLDLSPEIPVDPQRLYYRLSNENTISEYGYFSRNGSQVTLSTRSMTVGFGEKKLLSFLIHFLTQKIQTKQIALKHLQTNKLKDSFEEALFIG